MKNKHHKNIKIIILLIVLVTIILIGYFLILPLIENNIKNKIDIKSGDIVSYDLLRCLSDIPLKYSDEYKKQVPMKILTDVCHAKYKIPKNYTELPESTLIRDKRIEECVLILKETGDYKLYNDCIKETLPKLQLDYPHVKEYLISKNRTY